MSSEYLFPLKEGPLLSTNNNTRVHKKSLFTKNHSSENAAAAQRPPKAPARLNQVIRRHGGCSCNFGSLLPAFRMSDKLFVDLDLKRRLCAFSPRLDRGRFSYYFLGRFFGFWSDWSTSWHKYASLGHTVVKLKPLGCSFSLLSLAFYHCPYSISHRLSLPFILLTDVRHDSAWSTTCSICPVSARFVAPLFPRLMAHLLTQVYSLFYFEVFLSHILPCFKYYPSVLPFPARSPFVMIYCISFIFSVRLPLFPQINL